MKIKTLLPLVVVIVAIVFLVNLNLKVGEKTYNTLIKEELYSKVDNGTRLEVLQYKDRVKLYDSYDLK